MQLLGRVSGALAGVLVLLGSSYGAPACAQASPSQSSAHSPAAGAPLVAIVGGSVPNLDGGPALRDAVIVIEADRIKAVGPAASTSIPAGARIVHADHKWLIPGLTNMHVHLDLVLPGVSGAALANESDAARALRMAENARLSLESGVTTVRLVGTKGGTDFALKDAIDRGVMPGPRIFTAGEILGTTGGHGIRPGQGLDGPYEAAKGVREQIRLGATWIKLAISGGIADSHGAIGASEMSKEELRAAIDAAHERGVKVTAHASSAIAVNDAVDAGIDCIEHGFLLTEPVIRKMKDKGVYLVPTIVVSQAGAMEFFRKIGSPDWYLARVRSVGKIHWAALQTAIRLGVPIVLGTDQFPFEPNEGTTATVREAELYVEAGMTPLRALRAATIEPAKLLGAQDDMGQIAAGKYADIIGVDADPTHDIRALRTIGLVMKGGRIVRNDWGN
jgi:imidazolonepropionase-like amidohydrolase